MVPFGVVGDQFGDLVLIEALAQLHGRFALGLAVYDAGSALSWQIPQVSGLRGVLVRRKYLVGF